MPDVCAIITGDGRREKKCSSSVDGLARSRSWLDTKLLGVKADKGGETVRGRVNA